jgi:hypothetical protein
MPVVCLHDGAEAPYVACWLDVASKDTRPLGVHKHMTSDVPHLTESAADALLCSGSRARPHAYADVRAFVGVDLSAQYSINLQGSWRALDVGQRGLAVRVKYGSSKRALRFKCPPGPRMRDGAEWCQRVRLRVHEAQRPKGCIARCVLTAAPKVNLKNAEAFKDAMRRSDKPTLKVQVAALDDQDHCSTELVSLLKMTG